MAPLHCRICHWTAADHIATDDAALHFMVGPSDSFKMNTADMRRGILPVEAFGDASAGNMRTAMLTPGMHACLA